MFNYNPENHEIKLTKGDSAYFILQLEYIDGINYDQLNSDILVLGVKRTLQSKIYALMYETDLSKGNLIEIRPEDTEKLQPGYSHVYDVELRRQNGDVFTIIPYSPFIIDWEVVENVK